jgi:condensin-2 complex subunit D3
MRFDDLVSGSVPAKTHRVREHAVLFVKHMMQREECIPAVRLLIQHTCTKVPDRAPYRAAVASSVASLVGLLPTEAREEMMVWITKYSRNTRIGYRIFALELAPHFLNNAAVREQHSTVVAAAAVDKEEEAEENDVLGDAAAAEAPTTTVTVSMLELFMKMVISRANDKAPSVRSKALGIIALVFGHAETAANPSLLEVIKAQLSPSLAQLSSAMQAELTGSPVRNGQGFSSPQPAATHPADVSSMAANCGLRAVLARRANDPKSAVRKSALQAIEAMTTFEWYSIGQEELAALHQGCIDPATTVRKQALNSLTIILTRFPTEDSVQRAWLDSAMPLSLDKEETISRRAADALHDVILKPAAQKAQSGTAMQCLAWKMLALVDEKQDLRRYLQRLCSHWARENVFKTQLFDNVLVHVSGATGGGGWSLLSDMTAVKPTMLNPEVIVAAWRSRELDNLVITSHILTIVGHVSARLEPAVCDEISTELKEMLQQFTAAAGTISVMMQTLAKLDCASNNGGGGAVAGLPASTKSFATKLFTKCESMLAAVVFSKDPVGTYDEVSVVRQLFTLGELSLICPEGMTERQTLVVQALMAEDVPGLELDTNESMFPGKAGHAPAVRAHAFLTIGKFCLQNEELSKTVISTFVRELDHCKDPAVRNNVVVVMTDLCVRHPNLIQPYLPTIASCLRDPTVMVRRQTITLLTRLLKEDYIKLRGSLFFRLLMCLVDVDEGVRTLGEFCVLNLLLEKDAGLFPVHFVECIFHFNSVRTHPIYNRFPQSERDVEAFSLAGTENKSKRLEIYKLMLSKFGEFDKLTMMQRLSQEVLGAIADGVMPLDAGTEAVLADTLSILSSDDIKLKTKTADDEDPDLPAAETAAAKAGAKAKGTLITKITKKAMVENIVPVVIALKAHLERVKSPLMKHLMAYLRQMFNDYKDEVGDIMAADKQLANEILYDIRRYEEEMAAAKLAAQTNTPKQANKPAGGGAVGGANPFQSPGLRDATPQNSPLLSPSIFASANGQPGSPKFKAPLLRGQGGGKPSLMRSRLSVVTGSFATPITTPVGTPTAAGVGTAAAVGSAARANNTGGMGWVRTPMGKAKAIPLPSPNVVLLGTPGVAPGSKLKAWPIKAAPFADLAEEDEAGASGGAKRRGAADAKENSQTALVASPARKSARAGTTRRGAPAAAN